MTDIRMPASTDDLLDLVWARLEAGARSGSDPFHTACLATGGAGGPSARTVVLRRVDRAERRICCHTDARSEKAEALAVDPRATWVFYDPRERVQLRVWGRVKLHADDALAQVQWAASGLGGRRCYLSDGGPGAVLTGPGSGLPRDLEERAPTEAESAAGRPFFTVVACQLDAMDWLVLDGRGHRRARLAWTNGAWRRDWITP